MAWSRSDKAFFAAGACHVLAFTFHDLHPDEGYEIIHIKVNSQDANGTHVYESDGEWAFDFNGWTKETELLHETEKAERSAYPNWTYERIVVKEDLEAFCKNNNHRPPAYFAYLPWERTYKYIEQFDSKPPDK